MKSTLMNKVLFLVFVLAWLPAVLPASANPIIVTPPEFDVRYHKTDEHIFIAASESGWVRTFSKVPNKPSSETFPNGTEFLIYFYACIEDECWAEVSKYCYPWQDEFRFPDSYSDQYISVKDLVPAYESDDFFEEHLDEIQPFDEIIDFCSMVPFPVWKYPHSKVKLAVMDSSYSYRYEKCDPNMDFKSIYHVDWVYIDENNDRWVTYGNRSEFGGWVNIGPAPKL